MKVITVKQPYASLIAEGYKEYEFRTWKSSYRGELYIHAGLGVDKEVEFSTYDILVNDTELKDAIADTIIKNLKVCPSNMNLAGAEVELVSAMSREQRLKEGLVDVKDEFDFIFIDCPPSLGLITLNAFTASDSVLIPVQCE